MTVTTIAASTRLVPSRRGRRHRSVGLSRSVRFRRRRWLRRRDPKRHTRLRRSGGLSRNVRSRRRRWLRRRRPGSRRYLGCKRRRRRAAKPRPCGRSSGPYSPRRPLPPRPRPAPRSRRPGSRPRPGSRRPRSRLRFSLRLPPEWRLDRTAANVRNVSNARGPTRVKSAPIDTSVAADPGNFYTARAVISTRRRAGRHLRKRYVASTYGSSFDGTPVASSAAGGPPQ